MSTLSVDVPVLSPAEESRAAVAAPALAAPQLAAERNPTLDAARVFAALAIVWLHTIESGTLAHSTVLSRFGTPFFVFASIFFLLRPSSKIRQSFGAYAIDRFRRLYIPFLFWSVVFLVIRDGKRLLTGQPMLEMVPVRLFIGTALHFWFLPFIFLAGLLCFPLRNALPKLGGLKFLVAAICILIGIAISLLPTPSSSGRSEYLFRAIYNIQCFSPAVFWGVAFAIVYQGLPRKVTSSPWLAILGLTITTASIGVMWMTSLHPIGRNLAGMGWLMLALLPLQLSSVKWLAPIGRNSFGIYLVHPLFIEGLQWAARSAGQAPRWWLDVLTVLAAFLGSYLLTRLMRSSRWTAWTIP